MAIITGTPADDVLTGTAEDDTIHGLAGNDILNGMGGVNRLVGGLGDDTYYVGGGQDTGVELAGQGTDTVISSVSLTLLANFENLTLTEGAVIGNGNALNNVITGNSFGNYLTGGGGNDTLIGGGGNDILIGGAGNDILMGGTGDDSYFAGPGTDIYIENAGEGTDAVNSSISLTLRANFENLTLLGTANINGTGNELSNQMTGNAGNNVLVGGDGNDFIDGGAGIDTLRGGIGDDGYAMRAGDLIVEKADEGTDLVESSMTYTLPANVENLNLHGTANINATGNALNNTIIGNDGNNILDGRGGDLDTLAGGKGNDTYVYTGHQAITENADEGTDTVKASVSQNLSDGDNLENVTLTGLLAIDTDGNAANNVLTGNGAANLLAGFAGNDTLKGGGGNDILIGGDGNDTLVGGAGADTFVFDTAPGSTNRDAITDFVHGQDHMQFDLAAFAGVGSTGALDPAQFHSGAGMTTATQDDDRFIYNTTNGALYYDADGTGASEAIQVATLTNHAPINSTDILIA